MTIEDLRGKRVAILGLGTEGIALAEFLLPYSDKITLCDQSSESEILEKTDGGLRERLAKVLSNQSFNKMLGQDFMDHLEGFDIVFRSPSVYFNDPRIIAAKDKGVIFSSQIKLFFELCPCPIIGVTGTKGKGTTASLIYEIIKNFFQSSTVSNAQLPNKRNVYLAGNIGISVINLVSEIKRHDIVVLELSNFQLADLEHSPHIAVMTNLGVDHLDYHQNIEEYRDSKLDLVRYQIEKDYAILNRDSTFSAENLQKIKSQTMYFSASNQNVDAFVASDDNQRYSVFLREGDRTQKVCDSTEIAILGSHNLENICAASLVARILEIPLRTIRNTVLEFAGLPHRLELVGEKSGVKYINDSFATNPGPTIAAIKSFHEPKILILGGSSKNSDFTELAQIISAKNSGVKAVISIGTESKRIGQSLELAGYKGNLIRGGETLENIVKQAKIASEEGDIILFSPACASFDMFKNYKIRGDKFKEAVSNLIRK